MKTTIATAITCLLGLAANASAQFLTVVTPAVPATGTKPTTTLSRSLIYTIVTEVVTVSDIGPAPFTSSLPSRSITYSGFPICTTRWATLLGDDHLPTPTSRVQCITSAVPIVATPTATLSYITVTGVATVSDVGPAPFTGSLPFQSISYSGVPICTTMWATLLGDDHLPTPTSKVQCETSIVPVATFTPPAAA